ncbi:hypothetical protein [Candidatus Nanosyncoccus alces]|uniref:Uncharacterized protein n=1 Tax=Candidatus Nanosyncoccus alces TaxID=2171997 RepID=A0ABY0FMC9_9BACT|nr:hypothetical protein [Candidatus Nanosyncoccus alces]RYC75012.1 hypothetical protein G3RUM_00293 [Candidatus Nanosyncoccus alces]
MAREINLVPDIKSEMIKTLKLRNFIFFLCIVVAAASIGVTTIVGLIMGGQQLALDSKKSTLESLSTKLNSYSDLDDFLTIKDQLGNINTLTNNKKVLSRTFNILSALIPTGADTITVSELNVSLSGDQPTFSFDAQANAGKEPFIDYNVLDSFKKSMQYMRYDYGNYVDKNGAIIPAYCMIESGQDGATFTDSSRGIYAFWTINAEGCNPSTNTKTGDYNTEDYNGEQVVRIWRTPQYNDWYKQTEVAGQPYMSLDGQISGVEHFESSCITYTGNASQNSANPKWIESNESCLLVPGGIDGIAVSDSSNGRGAGDELVLRFSAVISLAPEVYNFTNSHVLAIAPSGRHNVTDSYVQIQAMFGERARDCAEGDTVCSTNTNNVNGEN